MSLHVSLHLHFTHMRRPEYVIACIVAPSHILTYAADTKMYLCTDEEKLQRL